MTNGAFEIDPGFAKLSIQLGRFGVSHVLLMNNADIPWFMLIPETTEIELCDLARSEEHTSELQSHVRISYAVFCLKKKNKKKQKKTKQKRKRKRKTRYRILQVHDYTNH